jgi:hypothetical protein
MERGLNVTLDHLQPPLPAALHVLHRWAPTLRVEATTGAAPIQWVSPWDEAPPPEQAARYARMASPPRAVRSLPRAAANRFAVAQPDRVDALTAWLTPGVAALLPAEESARVGDLLRYIADLLVTWIAVDPDVLLLDTGDAAVHLLHRTGDRAIRFSFTPAGARPAPDEPGVADLLAFLLPVTPTRGVQFVTGTGPWHPEVGLVPVEERAVYETLYRAVYIHATAIARPGMQLGRLAVRLMRDVLDSAAAAVGGEGAWYAAGLPMPLRFDAEGAAGRIAVVGADWAAYIDAGCLAAFE